MTQEGALWVEGRLIATPELAERLHPRMTYEDKKRMHDADETKLLVLLNRKTTFDTWDDVLAWLRQCLRDYENQLN
jgi:hypothetical protein